MRLSLAERAGIACLTLAAGLLRVWRFDHMSLWTDEGLTFYRAAKSVDFILSGRIDVGLMPTTDVQPPLYFLLMSAWLGAVGAGTWTAKFFSLAAAYPLTPLVWALGRRTAGRNAALAAAALAALSPAYLWYSQEVRHYTLAVALAVAAVYATLRGASGGGNRWWILAAGTTAALLWTHYLGFMLLPVLALSVLVRRGPRALRWAVVAGGAILAAAAPLVPFAVYRLGLGAERDQRFVPLSTMVADVARGFTFGLSGDASGQATQAAVWILAAAGVWGVARRRRGDAVVVAAFLGLPVLGLFAITLVKPVYMGLRHILLASPALYVLMGAGLTTLATVGRSGASRAVGAALAVLAGGLVLGAMAVSAGAFYTNPRVQKDDLRQLAQYVDERAVDGDVLVLSDAVLEHVFDVLARRVPLASAPLPGDPRSLAEQLAGLFNDHPRLWFMTPGPEAEDWLLANAIEVDRREFPGRTIPVRVSAYEARQSAEQMRPVAGGSLAMAGQEAATAPDLAGLRVIGWQLRPDPLQTGLPGRVHLALAGQGPVSDLKLAVRLVSQAGEDAGSADHAPFHGVIPIAGWPRAESLRVPMDLAVSPAAAPGVYRLAVTAYDPENGRTWPESGPLVLGEVSVNSAFEDPVVPLPLSLALAAEAKSIRIVGADVPPGPWPAGASRKVVVFATGTDGADAGTLLRLTLEGDSGVVAEADSALAGASHVRGHAFVLRPRNPGRAALLLTLVDAQGEPADWRTGPLGLGKNRALELGDVVVTDAPQGQMPDLTDTSGAVFGAGMVLSGYRLEPGAEGGLEVTLVWEARTDLVTDWVVTVQLLPGPDAGDHRPVAQNDAEPDSGRRPTGGWQAGDVVVDRRVLPPPTRAEPGPHRLVVAVYAPDTGERLTVTGPGAAGDHAVIATLPDAP